MDLSDSFPDLSHNEEGPPPTDEEQQQMALFWAKEEAQVGVASSLINGMLIRHGSTIREGFFFHHVSVRVPTICNYGELSLWLVY